MDNRKAGKIGLLAMLAGVALAGSLSDSGSGASARLAIPGMAQAATVDYPPAARPRALTIYGKPRKAIWAGEVYRFRPVVLRPGGGSSPLVFSIHNKPVWALFDPQTGLLSGIPTDEQAGSYGGIQITVHDGEASAELQEFSIVVGSRPGPSRRNGWGSMPAR